ncbi:reprolysin-like metallopeptidase [Flavobacterium sp.]|uniref:zinc-dependent metalloprotease n=1 Tax=Flavobacterium sp. TaxID=239 RepID=UPI0039E5648F
MKKLLLFSMVVLSSVQLSAQKNAWRKVSLESVDQLQRIKEDSYSERKQLFQVNVNAIKQTLAQASDKLSTAPGVVVEFPNIDGQMEKFQVWENSNFAPELQAQYPEIRAYIGKNMTDGSTIHFSVSPLGIQTMLLRPDRTAEFIEPYTKDHATYVLFDSQTRERGRLPFNCATEDVALNNDVVDGITARSSNLSYKTMRLALSCTGEYTTYFGGTVAGALAGMNNTMTRVNGVMEIDLAIHLNIIANNNLVIYTNAATDPYSTAAVGTAAANADNLNGWNLQLQNALTAQLGNGAYDIGHLFGASGGGGNAGCIGCVCRDDDTGTNMDKNKGSGYTSPSNNIPAGDSFDIDYVIHEMGHQMGANHTFSHNVEGASVNIEPGSGSTIMAYAGITVDYDVQQHSDPYFTYRSIQQIQDNMATKTCPVSTAITSNTPPTVTAPADFTVPSGTAYILKGVVTDAEGDTLSYCWEQNNNASSAFDQAQSICYPTKTGGPNYRSFNPKTVPDRYLPEYSKVLAGQLSTTWESVSSVQRSLRFTLTVRDNHVGGWQTNTDEVIITSAAPYNGIGGVGPFQVTSQNTTGVLWGAPGTNQTVTWDVNNTTSLPGSANINIKLSTDGGLTWPITLVADTPNDGNEVITVPAVTSTNCRILIEPTGNVYYAVNSNAFAIGYELVTTCTTYNYDTPFTLNDNSTSYNVKQINVPTAGTISDVNIHINATHPNIQNLNIAVIRPGGSMMPLFNQQCAGNANMNVTFDSEAAAFACGSPLSGTMALPTGTLAAMNGFSQMGNWQFGFRDLAAGNVGTIDSFWLEICSTALVPLKAQEFDFANFALYPNPNNGSFKVEFNASSKVSIQVHDISGRRIFNKAYDSTGLFSQEIQLTNAQAGVYLVSIADGDKKMVKRIVVE